MCDALMEFKGYLRNRGKTCCNKTEFITWEPSSFPEESWAVMLGIFEEIISNPDASKAILDAMYPKKQNCTFDGTC